MPFIREKSEYPRSLHKKPFNVCIDLNICKKPGNVYLVLLIFLASTWLQYQDLNEVIIGWTNIRSVKTQFLFLGGKEFFFHY